MYERFYKLTERPFKLTPDLRYLFKSRSHNRALAYLRYGLQQGEGFMIITGDVGAGKTTLARALLSSLTRDQVHAAELVSTRLEADDMLRMVVAAFGLASQDLTKSVLLKNLENFMKARAREGRRLLLLVDESQNLPVGALEELRMLSNYQSGDRPMLQTFLLGQEEFRATLAADGMEQFRQRVTAAHHLGPMDVDDTRQYIEHRLRVAGWNDDPHFTPGAYETIFHATGGVPRRVNTLCDRLLLHGAIEEIHTLAEDTVHLVVEEQQRELGRAAPAQNLAQAPDSVVDQAPVFVPPVPAAAPVPPAPQPEVAPPHPEPPRLQLAENTVSDVERRMLAVEKRMESLEKQVRSELERTKKLLMMAVLAGDDIDMTDALKTLRKVDEA
jgi:putative secretion ATPase (PEP-CTERM system associated)